MTIDSGVRLGAFLTLGIISFLYKDNPVSKIREAIIIGRPAGYQIVCHFWQSIWPKLVLNPRDVVTSPVDGHGPHLALHRRRSFLLGDWLSLLHRPAARPSSCRLSRPVPDRRSWRILPPPAGPPRAASRS